MKRFADEVPCVCGVCKRQAGGLAAGDIGKSRSGAPKPRIWLCDNLECLKLSHKVLTMPVRDLSTLEEWALADAGNAAGSYLESLGKTDLGELTPQEWTRFLKTVLTSYESQMRQRLNERLGKAAA